MKISKALITFLTNERPTHNGQDLLDFYLRHGTDLETQCNVAAGDGHRVEGKLSTYTDGINSWHAFRIPKKADSHPTFEEYELKWPLELHAEAIGSTGWDWKNRVSRYVGFDFDAISGHAAGVGVEDEKLDAVRDAAKSLPYVQCRRSTGGAGLHLYVFFEDGIRTDNHTEHAAVARCILGIMSAECGFNFASAIDTCGSNMWFWHRKSNAENRGLELLKPAERLFYTKDLPPNWRDHIEVVTRKRAKLRLSNVSDKEFDIFEALASAHRVVPLGEDHRAHMEEFQKMGFSTVWVPEHNLLQTHTVAFRRLMDEKKDQYKLEGFFSTNSNGKHPEQPNCFAFPGDFGSWKLYRFGQGTNEAKTWEQDGSGWTTCFFNRKPNLKQAARALGGRDMKKKGHYEFNTLADAVKVAEALGQPVEIEETLKNRKAVVHKSEDGRLAIEVPKTSDDDKIIGDWNTSDKKGSWTQVFDCPAEPVKDETLDFDNKVRALETPDGDRAGWSILKDSNNWCRCSSGDVKNVLYSYGQGAKHEEIMGISVRKAWKLVNLPFRPEYPGDRQWNVNAAQYAYPPASRSDESTHPHWDLILDHAGKDLDPFIRDLAWAKEANIRTGGDYLRTWFACVLHNPFCRLPYLFFFGDENCGKSIVWEAFQLLVTKGVVKADRALTSHNDFNGELDGAILCVVEEKDISKAPGAAAKIKDAVTSLTLSIRKMRMDSYQVLNMSHWMQFSNDKNACHVTTGDTRITMIHVTRPEKEIPKEVLIERLKLEAPAFMRTMMDTTLPKVEGRLSLPLVETSHKANAENLGSTALTQFLRLHTCYAPGDLILFAELYEKFHEWMDADERHHWSRVKVSRALPANHPCGAFTDNKKFVANIAWGQKEIKPDAKQMIVKDGKLKRED